MDFREREIDFREADRRYAELKRRLDAGTISTEEFHERLRELMVRDDEGRWWAKSRKTGEWHYHDGGTWVRGTPPGYQPPPTLPDEGTPDRRSQPEQGEPPPTPQTTPLGSVPTQEQTGGKQRRGVSRWVGLVAAGIVGVAVLVGIGIIATMGAKPESSYDLAEDGSGALSVEVPFEWQQHITGDSEGEKGKGWSSFLGETAGPSITAVNGLDAWRNGSAGHRGVYAVASKKLAQKYTDDELVVIGPNDYSSGCEAGTVQDFDRPPYSGKMLEWKNCGGISGHEATTVAAAPEGRECVVVLQVGGFLEGYEEDVRHVLDTFETDCSKID